MTPRWLVDPAAVALGTVAPEQRELARNLIAADPEFRAEVERLHALAGTLRELPADAWSGAAADVPPLDLDVVLAAQHAAPAGPAPAEPVPTRPPAARGWTLRPAWALVASVLLLALGGLGGALLAGGDDAPPRGARANTDPWVFAALRPLPNGGSPGAAGRVALVLRPGGQVRLRARGLPPTRAGAFYEAWLMTDTRRLVALGTFAVGADGRADVTYRVGADPRAYRFVDVSLQRQSDGPEHSGVSVLRSAQIG